MQTFSDRLSHTGNGEQINGFLYGPPILFRDKHSIGTLPGNEDRLMGSGCLID
jgi:hypothetical protein